MNRQEFLEKLRLLLGDLSEEEREEAIQYYEDYFADAGPEMEEQVIRELGSPEKVALMIREAIRGEEPVCRDRIFSEPVRQQGCSGRLHEEKNRGFGLLLAKRERGRIPETVDGQETKTDPDYFDYYCRLFYGCSGGRGSRTGNPWRNRRYFRGFHCLCHCGRLHCRCGCCDGDCRDSADDCRLRSGASCLRHRLVVAGGRGSGYGF